MNFKNKKLWIGILVAVVVVTIIIFLAIGSIIPGPADHQDRIECMRIFRKN